MKHGFAALTLGLLLLFSVNLLSAQLIQERGCCLVPPAQKPGEPLSVVIRVWELTNEEVGTQVKETLEGLPGVDTTNICLRTGSVTVQYTEETITPTQMLEVVKQQGFTGLIWPACCLLAP